MFSSRSFYTPALLLLAAALPGCAGPESWGPIYRSAGIGVAVAVAIGVLTLIGIATRIVRTYAAELERNARERAAMLQDLHDGIGGIMTNISLLADVAARGSSAEQIRRAVTDISQLSREGSDEIRVFVESLDAKELSWTRLVRRLRYLGKVTLEPHGVEFDLEATVDPNTAPPTPLLLLNVVRVYRESLTNVVKHSRARTVDARMSVSVDSFRVEVSDDGVGVGPALRRRGRGLSGMASRARALGGTFTIDSSRGTTVALSAPLPRQRLVAEPTRDSARSEARGAGTRSIGSVVVAAR